MSFTRSTHTFTLEWVQEVPAHFAVISRRSRRVVHSPHVVRGTLEGGLGGDTGETSSYKQHFKTHAAERLDTLGSYSPLASHPCPRTLWEQTG